VTTITVSMDWIYANCAREALYYRIQEFKKYGLGVGLSGKSGSFATYISLLKRNNLIKEENGLIFVNPDL
jgi:hypothetical protein